MKNRLLLLLLFTSFFLRAQLPSECQLDIGVNLGGLADFGTELPFVDLMKNARQWYTKDIENPNAAFNSEQATNLNYRTDGYPIHVPQTIPESAFDQKVVTIWGMTAGWPSGEYTLLWEGDGELGLFGALTNLTTTGPGRMTFDFDHFPDAIVELTIERSELSDPIRNIRLLMPGSEATYLDQPFNPVFIDRMQDFKTVRFMDWGQTNNWGQKRDEGWDNPALFSWSDRPKMDHYTWAYEKGIPYEMMVKLLNDYDLDGWLCVPHRSNADYVDSLAIYFRDNLEPERHLYVEYSNEIWNWIFGQTQWLNKYGCEARGLSWPEGLVSYVQQTLDGFTNAFAGELGRITRVVGTPLSWVDVSQRIANNLTPGSFDAITPTCYFGFTDQGETALDQLGSAATVADVALHARTGMAQSIGFIEEQKTMVADPLGVPLIFYEGGQHLTPNPFGVYPSYGQALIDAQRDTSMYNLYNEWFNLLRGLQTDDQPLRLMHFSFVANRSAQFGSWGMLETMDQDVNVVPAPKYQAVLENQAGESCQSSLSVEWETYAIETANCTATIRWETNREENNHYFEISRSTDGNRYAYVTRVLGNTDNNGRLYSYSDDNLEPGVYYYQISQVDHDGSSEVLDLRRVELNCERGALEVDVYPNPANEVLWLKTAISSSGVIKVYNLSGQQLSNQITGNIASTRLSISDLRPGVYVVNVYTDKTGRMITQRFVKK